MDPWKELANAVIAQAAKDYRSASIQHRKYPKRISHILMMHDCEEFFLSDWFLILTDLDGNKLFNRLKEELK